jgi:hypothetical protein
MRYTVTIAGLLLVACSGEQAEEERHDVLRDAARAPLDKAESVEATLLEGAEKRDEAIDKSGG